MRNKKVCKIPRETLNEVKVMIMFVENYKLNTFKEIVCIVERLDVYSYMLVLGLETRILCVLQYFKYIISVS